MSRAQFVALGVLTSVGLGVLVVLLAVELFSWQVAP